MINKIKNKIFSGEMITKEEALVLQYAPLDELCKAADEIRKKFCSDTFDMCTIINGKSGKCSENCKYCAQSSHYSTCTEEYPLVSADKMVEQALYNYNRGVLRYSIVCSGRKLPDNEVDELCDSIREIKKVCNISVCVSLGLLDENNFRKLKAAGVDRVHNNLETSERFFPQVCTTHTFQDKINAINAAKSAGLEVCSGGIVGLGETMEDRIDMVLKARELGIKSIPLNMLNPIKNTPFENNLILTSDEMARITAIFRFIIPDGFIRLAGGRGLMEDKGERLFKSGANAAISGDMLTTQGITIEKDMAMTSKLGYTVKFSDKCKKGIFVTATGTDCGKTYITALIIKKLRENGINVGYYKAALSGADNIEESDAGYVNKIANIGEPENMLVSYLYKTAVSPHLAAKIEGNPVELSVIKAAFDRVKEKYEYVTVEGSGGIVCPIRYDDEAEIFLEDIIKLLGLDCIIIADAGLGTINSVVTTCEYMNSRDIEVKGIILNNWIGGTMQEDNINMIESITGIPVCGVVKNGDTELDVDIEILKNIYGDV